jgi:hypothetical protein
LFDRGNLAALTKRMARRKIAPRLKVESIWPFITGELNTSPALTNFPWRDGNGLLQARHVISPEMVSGPSIESSDCHFGSIAPSWSMTVMITSTIPAATTPYSIVVAAFLINRRSFTSMSNYN